MEGTQGVLKLATSGAEDPGGESGWSIADVSRRRSADSTAGFTTEISGTLRIAVLKDPGTPPGIPTGNVALDVPNVYRVPAVVSVVFSSVADPNGTDDSADHADTQYQWQRLAANGTTVERSNIGRGSTCTLKAAAVGKKIRAVVMYTDDDGYREGPLTTPASEEVTAASTCASPPAVSGGAKERLVSRLVVGDPPTETWFGLEEDGGIGSMDVVAFRTSQGNNHTIDDVSQLSNGTLHFSLEAGSLSADEKRQLVVYVCDEAFALKDASTSMDHSYEVTGNLDWSMLSERTIRVRQDSVALEFVSATVNDQTLIITFSEALAAVANLANSAFEVKKTPSGGTEETVTLSTSEAPTMRGVGG